jgi:diacylglycerol O-acyltransferase
VQSYAGLLEFGLTACRRVLSQEESYELVEHLRSALGEIEALPSVDADAADPPAVRAANKPGKPSTKNKQPAGAQPGAH